LGVSAGELAELQAIDGLGTGPGIMVRTGNATYALRTILGGDGIAISNGNGSVNPSISLDINGLAGSVSNLADGDKFAVYDASNGDVRTTTWSNVKSELAEEVTGLKSIEATITYNGGATQSVGTLPDNSKVLRSRVEIDSGSEWDVTETIQLGVAGNLTGIMDDSENDPEQNGIFEADVLAYSNQTGGSVSLIATVTSGNTPTQGTARIIIEYYTGAVL
jgi:hypothetical protein